jgi:hypothetical protein
MSEVHASRYIIYREEDAYFKRKVGEVWYEKCKWDNHLKSMGMGESGLCGMSRCTGWKMFTSILKDRSTFAFTFLHVSVNMPEYTRRTPLWEHGTAYPKTIGQMLLLRYAALDHVNS